MSHVENFGDNIGEVKKAVSDAAGDMAQVAGDLAEENRTFSAQRTEAFEKVKEAVQALKLLAGAVTAGRADAIGTPLASVSTHLGKATELATAGEYAKSNLPPARDAALGINGLVALYSEISSEGLADSEGIANDMRRLIGRISDSADGIDALVEHYHNGGVRAAEATGQYATLSEVVLEHCDDFREQL